jgi:Polyketide cyclase / dehydrase and lipid transport
MDNTGMSSNEYHFITHWKMKATRQEVYDILSDTESLKKWWPSVYLDVKQTAPGNENSIGKKVKLYTKGWLPYTLLWDFEVTENIKPVTFTIKAMGDFEGRGIWHLQQSDDDCYVSFDWKLAATKPLLKYLSFLMKPIFSANHKWAMKKGKESLRLEILRRRVNSKMEWEKIPAPPSPTFPHNIINNRKFI